MPYKYKGNEKEYMAIYRAEHKEKAKEQKREHYLRHKDKIKARSAAYRVNHKKKLKEYHTTYCAIHQLEKKEYRAKYYLEHREELKESYENYRVTHKKERKESNKKYMSTHRQRINEYRKNKRLMEPLFRMACNLRKRTCYIFKKMGLHKSCKTEALLGTDYKTVMQHIESQFIFGMTWENYGEWHIDHKKPLALAKTEKQLIKLCNYTNLQPLWKEENASKKHRTDFVVEEVRFG